MARQIDLDQLMKYPLRRGSEHCDEKNADPRFLNGVESILEWAQTLPTLTPPEIVYCQDCVHHKAYEDAVVESGLAAAAGNEDAAKSYELFKAGLYALRPVSREQVEKMRGEWIIEDAGDGDRRKKCSLCNQPISGWWGRDMFCANCGAPMTDEAVEMVMERINKMAETGNGLG